MFFLSLLSNYMFNFNFILYSYFISFVFPIRLVMVSAELNYPLAVSDGCCNN